MSARTCWSNPMGPPNPLLRLVRGTGKQLVFWGTRTGSALASFLRQVEDLEHRILAEAAAKERNSELRVFPVGKRDSVGHWVPVFSFLSRCVCL